MSQFNRGVVRVSFFRGVAIALGGILIAEVVFSWGVYLWRCI